jgi:hypothetical protein
MPRHFPVTGEITDLGCPRLPATVGHCKIADTAFHNNWTPMPCKPEERLTIRDVAVSRCAHWACSANGAVLDDITITDLRGGGRAPSFLWGCVYSRVRLRGWISGLMWRWQLDPNDDAKSRRFLQANLAMYESVEWALDITEARFSFYESLMGIPARLVRRDSTAQFVMTQESARQLANDAGSSSVWHITAAKLVESGLNDTVIVLGGTGKSLRSRQDQAKALLDRGLLA